MIETPSQLEPPPRNTPGYSMLEERARDRRESLMWLILAIASVVVELRLGFIDGMHFVPARVLGNSIGIIVINVVLMAMIPFAVKVNHELGLPGGPLITSTLSGEERPYPWSEVLRDGAVWTIVLAIVSFVNGIVWALFIVFFNPPVPGAHHGHSAAFRMSSTGWLVFDAVTGAIGAGVVEEILFRFVLMGVFSWVLVTIQDNVDRRPTRNQLWLATILQGYCFGLMHIVYGSELAKGTTGVSGYAARALVLPQTWAGMVFGRQYLKRGLEAAIAAHIIWDLILGLGLVMLARNFGVATRS